MPPRKMAMRSSAMKKKSVTKKEDKKQKTPVEKKSMKKSMKKSTKKDQQDPEEEEEEQQAHTPAPKGKKISKKSPKGGMKKSPKKPEKKKTNAAHIKELENAFTDGFGLDTHIIIQNLVKPCLETPANERIGIQRQGIAMIEVHMEGVRQHLGSECHAKQAYLDSTSTIEATLNSKHEQLNHRKELLDEQKASVVVKEEQELDALDDADKALKEAKATKKQVADDGPAMEKNFKTVQEMQGNEYRQLLTDPPSNSKDSKKLIKVVTDVCKNVLNLESAMVDSIPSVLATQPDDRGAFANMSLSEVEKAMRFWMSDIQMRIANHGSNVAHSEQNLATAQAEKERCESELEQTRAVLEQVEGQIEQNKNDIKGNDKALKQHPKDVKQGEDERKQANARAEAWAAHTEVFFKLKLEETEKESEDEEMVDAPADSDEVDSDEVARMDASPEESPEEDDDYEEEEEE